MIPKKIHYCWFGGKPLNDMGIKCRESWKKYFPDHEIIEWNETNFNFQSCQYVKEAYEAKKWAFVSDYVRFVVLYEQGGIYFDTDVEVIRSFDDILENGSFMGSETASVMNVNPGLGFAVEPRNLFIKELIDDYHNSSFRNEDGSLDLTTIVERTTRFLRMHGLEDKNRIQTVKGITIYPVDYFCPIEMSTHKLILTENTRSIHHYTASWVDKKSKVRGKIYRFIKRNFGEKVAGFVQKIAHKGKQHEKF